MIVSKYSKHEGRFSLALRYLWRPVLIFAHILFIVLVVLGTGEDRSWNIQQTEMIPAPRASDILNCSHRGFSVCCRPVVLESIDRLYKQVQKVPRDLFFIEVMIYVSTISAMVCLFGSLLELMFKIDSDSWGHRAINKFATISYVFCFFLLSRGIINMEPTQKEKFLCTEHRKASVETQIINYCYQKLGICRNTDALLMVLLCMMCYPLLCFVSVCCGGSIGNMLLFTMDDKKPGLRQLKSRSSPSSFNVITGEKLELKPAATKPAIVPIHSPSEVKGQGHAQSRAQLHTLLHILERDPSCRHNENYLSMLARSFKSYIRHGNTPKMLNPTESIQEESFVASPSKSLDLDESKEESINDNKVEIPQEPSTKPPPTYEEVLAFNLSKIANQNANENLV